MKKKEQLFTHGRRKFLLFTHEQRKQSKIIYTWTTTITNYFHMTTMKTYLHMDNESKEKLFTRGRRQ